jgi:hypothetical protein
VYIVITLRDGKPEGLSSIPNREEDFHFLQSVPIGNGDLHNGYWRGVMTITDLHLVLRLRMCGFIPPYNVMVNVLSSTKGLFCLYILLRCDAILRVFRHEIRITETI